MPVLPTPGVTTAWGDDLNAAIESLHQTGTHAARPTTDLTTGTLYSCTDHNLIYRWDGAAWATYATLGGGGGGVLLLNNGASVPGGTAVGTVVFEKAANVASAIMADGPIAFLKLDETVGNWLDSSGNGYDFTPAASVQRGLAPIVDDGGYSAASGGSGIGNRTTTPAAITGDATIGFRVRIPSGAVSYSGGFAKIGGSGNGWDVSIGAAGATNSAGAYLNIGRNGIGWTSTGYTFAPGADYDVQVVRSGTTFSAYVNGVLAFSASLAINTPGAELQVGYGETFYLSSALKMDYVRFFNKALAPDRVSAHAAVSTGKAKGWWDGTTLRPLA